MQQLVWGRDYFVYYMPMPDHIGGLSTLNDDGTYNIYINSRHYADRQWKAFLHELVHCEAGHLDERSWLPPHEKEWEADHLRPNVIIPVDYAPAVHITEQDLRRVGAMV